MAVKKVVVANALPAGVTSSVTDREFSIKVQKGTYGTGISSIRVNFSDDYPDDLDFSGMGGYEMCCSGLADVLDMQDNHFKDLVDLITAMRVEYNKAKKK